MFNDLKYRKSEASMVHSFNTSPKVNFMTGNENKIVLY
jgi:hypothetical protein